MKEKQGKSEEDVVLLFFCSLPFVDPSGQDQRERFGRQVVGGVWIKRKIYFILKGERSKFKYGKTRMGGWRSQRERNGGEKAANTERE